MTTTAYRALLQQADDDIIGYMKEDFPNGVIGVSVTVPGEQGLSEDAFWRIIDMLDWTNEDDNQRILASAVEFLSQMPVAAIFGFDDILAEKLYHLDKEVYAKNMGDDSYGTGRGFSSDSFLYARCCVVANGKATYEAVLADPTEMPVDLTFESLLYLAQEAYRKKTGRDNYYHTTEFCYETFSNPDGWEETWMQKIGAVP